MGYTHYWRMTEPLKVTKTQRDLIQEVIDKHRIVLSGWDGTGSPEFTKNALSFNGIGPDDDHETFLVDFGEREGFSFCKTERKPYDIVVCKMLLILSLSKGFNFSSDGVEKNEFGKRYLSDETWPEALRWFRKKGYQETINKKINPYLNSR